nr:choice-of-anchor Q domain-containing protein [Bradymonas sediminis]
MIVATSASSSDLSLTVHSSTFHNNGASGVSLACNGQGRATVEVYNSLATNNSNVGLESSKSPGTCRINASYSNAWGNGSGDLSRISARDGMRSANPQYVDAANGDFRLQPSSVAIDSGTDIGAPAHDIDGAARPFNGDGINGAEYDMGAYEFGATFAACGDGVVAQDEECDDGNLEDGDGCSSACVIEDDGGGDVGVDAGPDAGLDAGFDSGPDAAPDAGGRYDGGRHDGEDEFIDDDIGEDQLDDAGHSNEDPADSGTPGKKGSEGCGCSATSGTPTPGSLALIALGAGLLFIRRRAASRKTPPMA